MKSPASLLTSLLHDCRRLVGAYEGLDRDVVTIKNRVEYEGNSFLSVTIVSLGKAIDKGLSSGKLTVPLGFSKRGALPRLFSGLLRQLFDIKTGLLVEEPDINVLRCLRDICYLHKKAIPSSDRDSRLDFEARTVFWSTDDDVKDVFSPQQIYWLTSVSRFLLAMGPSSDSDEFLPRHGPGSVYEGLSSHQKWCEVYRGVVDEDYRLLHLGYDLLHCHLDETTGVTDRSFRVAKTSPSKRPLGGIARLVTVPKSSTKKRTITVEPTLNQFLQQRLNSILRRSIERCNILRNCLALTDQGENQKLALIGSRDRSWSTIDLTSASDLLGLRLVELVFGAAKGSFLEPLIECRTPWVHDSLRSQKLRKYAGMGNATTFPIQSVVFAVLAIIAVLKHEGLSPSYKNVLHASKNVRVYGDDIIIRREHCTALLSEISDFGMKPNLDKTFTEGNFRESCGVDAYKGHIVTPVYAKTYLGSTLTDLDHLSDMVNLSNALRHYCYYAAAEHIRQYVDTGLRRPLPCVPLGRGTPLDVWKDIERGPTVGLPLPSSCGGLAWLDRQGSYLGDTRYNPDLQRSEIRIPFVVSKIRKDPIDGIPALIWFFHMTRLERVVGRNLEESNARFKSRIRLRWVPSYQKVESF